MLGFSLVCRKPGAGPGFFEGKGAGQRGAFLGNRGAFFRDQGRIFRRTGAHFSGNRGAFFPGNWGAVFSNLGGSRIFSDEAAFLPS